MSRRTETTLQQAKSAIDRGQAPQARRLLRQLLQEEPQNYVAWLYLAQTAPGTKASHAYAQRAASIRPDSLLVRQMLAQLEDEGGQGSSNKRPSTKLFIIFCGVVLVLAFLAFWLGPMAWALAAGQTSLSLSDANDSLIIPTIAPTFYSPEQNVVAAAPESEEQELNAIATPTLRPLPTATATVTATIVAEAVATTVEASAVTADNALLENEQAAGDLSTEDTGAQNSDTAPVEPESFPVVGSDAEPPAGVSASERWIDVNLDTQTLVAYEGDVPVFSSLISGGTWDHPTVTGQFRTWAKYESQDMNGYLLGYDYYLQDVPYVMYFFKDYAIHGTYWHTNFGTPMSHGCVNMSPDDAGWLFRWAPVGTLVHVHY